MRSAKSTPDFSGIPPSLRQHARNLSNWFPEVVAVLGAADLEEKFRQGSVHVREHETGKTLEVVLPKKETVHSKVHADSVAHTAPRRDLSQQLVRLDRLAADFEVLTAQLKALNDSPNPGSGLAPLLAPGARRSQACGSRTQPSVDDRLEAATAELVQLSDLLKAAPPPQPAPPASSGSRRAEPEAREGIRPPELRSARRGQAQQGGQNLHGAGRSRSTNKVPDWKSQLKIEVTKVKEMPEGDPKSPKGKAPTQAVWGIPKASAKTPQWRGDNTPNSMQARIEQKLVRMLGHGPSSRVPQRRQTLPASAFNHSEMTELARLHGASEPNP